MIISPVYLKPTHAVCYPAMQLQRTVIIYPVYLKPTHAVCALSGEFLLGFTFAIKMQQFPKGQILTVLMCPLLRPLTLGKRFLLFLPDSHSAYYDSSVSALGRSLPPSLGLSRICCTWSSFWRKRRALATLGKMVWERVWDFSALGGPTSSVSRRVVKLTVSHYYSVPLPLQKRGYGDEIRNLSCS